MDLNDILRRRAARRDVHGISAVLLPFTEAGEPDFDALESHVERTCRAGLDVAVNMDTGFGDLLEPGQRERVLDATRAVLGAGKRFYASALADPTDADLVGSYRSAIESIETRGAVPVLVQDARMHGLGAQEKADLYAQISEPATVALAFELGPVFAPHGEVWDEETFARILEIPRLAGVKHSSLDRETELRRLEARDRLRPDFRIYTGNDLAIDMVLYGSDYLLGLSTFSPEAFAARDRALRDGNASFFRWNDALQHLGNVGFRAPVPAYKHSAAMYLQITGRLDSDHIHPRAPRRPEADRVMLADCALRLGEIDAGAIDGSA